MSILIVIIHDDNDDFNYRVLNYEWKPYKALGIIILHSLHQKFGT